MADILPCNSFQVFHVRISRLYDVIRHTDTSNRTKAGSNKWLWHIGIFSVICQFNLSIVVFTTGSWVLNGTPILIELIEG